MVPKIELARPSGGLVTDVTDKLFAGKYAGLIEGIALDPSDIPHHETLEAYIDHHLSEYNMCDASVRPLLISRSLIERRGSDNAFRFGVSGNIDQEHANSLNRDCLHIEVLATIESNENAMYSAIRICADLRTLYLRHFPGRCHRNTSESNFDSFKPSKAVVYVAFFDKALRPPHDGA